MNSLKVAFLAGADTLAARSAIEKIGRMDGVDPVLLAVVRSRKAKPRGLRALYATIDRLADGVISPREVDGLLRKAFPDRTFSLQDTGRYLGCPVAVIAGADDPACLRLLRESGAELAIALATGGPAEVLKLGCLTVDKGGPHEPFWAIYDRAQSAQVTIRLSGEAVASTEVCIHPKETPDSLKEKLAGEAAGLLARTVANLQSGSLALDKTRTGDTPTARPGPSRAQVRELSRRLPQWPVRSAFKESLKTLLYSALLRTGVFGLIRAFHRASGNTRADLALPSRQ